jgi:hypothetical protein
MELIILQENENEDVLVPTEPTNDSNGINNDNHATNDNPAAIMEPGLESPSPRSNK